MTAKRVYVNNCEDPYLNQNAGILDLKIFINVIPAISRLIHIDVDLETHLEMASGKRGLISILIIQQPTDDLLLLLDRCTQSGLRCQILSQFYPSTVMKHISVGADRHNFFACIKEKHSITDMT